MPARRTPHESASGIVVSRAPEPRGAREAARTHIQALEQASRDWSATFDAINDMVCLLARDGTVLRCNKSMVTLLGLDADQVVGKKCFELMHGSRTFFEKCPYQEMLRTGKRESFELPLGEHWYQVTADPLFGEAEEIVGAVHIVREITATKQAREALSETSRWLSAVNALALELASLPAHADLGGFLAASLRETTGAVASAFSEYDDAEHTLVTRAVVLEPGILERVAGPLLKRMTGTRIAITDEMHQVMIDETIDSHPTLVDPGARAVPRAVSATVRRLLGTDRFTALSYVVDGELFGTSLLALKADAADPPAQLLEAFAHLAAVSLRRRRAEQELHQASAYNRRLIEASLDPLVMIGPDGMITDINAAAVAATGYARDELVGTDFADYFTEPAQARAVYEQVFREGSARDYPLEIRHHDGHLTAVLYNASTYRDAAGQVVGVFAAARDVGGLRRAEAKIRALNASLERRVEERTRELAAANRELQEFVYAVSHDLRSPLRAVDGFSLTVLEDYGDVIHEQGRSDLRRVRAAAQRMGELIDALLSLSRLGRREIELGQVDLSAIARRVLDELQEADPERRVEVIIEDGLVAEGDTALVDVVLENLLGNAWKFTAKRASARIEFGALQRDDRLAFFVHDNGAGFDPAYVDKLFTPFQRLHTAEQFPGTGIGLATVARVLGRLGGTWWAEGEIDGGATFFFTLSGSDAQLPLAIG
jgi:PAS domain S-box-containing protein